MLEIRDKLHIGLRGGCHVARILTKIETSYLFFVEFFIIELSEDTLSRCVVVICIRTDGLVDFVAVLQGYEST